MVGEVGASEGKEGDGLELGVKDHDSWVGAEDQEDRAFIQEVEGEDDREEGEGLPESGGDFAIGDEVEGREDGEEVGWVDAGLLVEVRGDDFAIEGKLDRLGSFGGVEFIHGVRVVEACGRPAGKEVTVVSAVEPKEESYGGEREQDTKEDSELKFLHSALMIIDVGEMASIR